MPDFTFLITEESELSRHKATRYAVLRPLCPTSLQLERNLQDHLFTAYRRWRAFLVRMRNAGWDRVQDRLDMGYIRNCPPCGMKTNRDSRPCQCTHICPWCWGRKYVLEPFRRFEIALFGSIARRTCRHPVKLIEFTVTYDPKKLAGWNDEEPTETSIGGQVKQLVSIVRSGRRQETSLIPNLGGYVLHSFNMLDKRVVLRRSGVLIVPEHAQVELPSHANIKFQEHRPIKEALMGILGRVARYPVGWFDHPPEMAMAYLAATTRLRMSALHGRCRRTLITAT